MVVDSPPAATAGAFVEIAHRIVWCTLATVDRRGRPRSRLVHPIWQLDGDGLQGWVTSRRTPLKVAHLAHAPYVSCSYWDPAHDTAVAECHATWIEDADEALDVWERCRALPPPAGFDPAAIWPGGPASGDAGLLHLRPWRLRVGTAAQLAADEALVWRAGSGGGGALGPAE